MYKSLPSTRKIAELCFETTAAHSTIYPKRSALSAFSLFEEQAEALLSHCHFHSFLIVHYIYYITGLQHQDLKPSADNNTRYSPSKSITECIKFTKRAELWTDFWHLDDIFKPPGRNELIVWKTDSRFFSLASHARRRVRLARFARGRLLRHALPIS